MKGLTSWNYFPRQTFTSKRRQANLVEVFVRFLSKLRTLSRNLHFPTKTFHIWTRICGCFFFEVPHILEQALPKKKNRQSAKENSVSTIYSLTRIKFSNRFRKNNGRSYSRLIWHVKDLSDPRGFWDRVFPRFRQCGCFHFEVSWPFKAFSLSVNWPFLFYNTQSKSGL